MSKMNVVFNPRRDRYKVDERVLEIKEKQDSESSVGALFSMLGDAVEEDAKIYKMEKPVKSNKEIPELIFL